MRKKLFLALFSLCLLGFSQEQIKDTLYVELNTDYLVDRSEYRGLAYREIRDLLDKKAQISRTNGLFIYKTYDTYRNSKSLHIQSLKDIVETRTFYYPGKYNTLVNKFVLKEKLLDSYTILLVLNDLVIRPLDLEYRYHDSSGKGKLKRQDPLKDSIYFKFDPAFIYQYSGNPDEYYINATDKYDDDWFSLIKDTIIEPKSEYEIQSLRDFISEIVYTTRIKRSLNDMELAEYLSNYHLFLVKGDTILKVNSAYSIE